ncbi:WYL domain-containing protein [Nostoc punctiforme FACHB-252]|uniref:WYL domain-containing protein n=2 Tax=Nostoc punctiforme TaxID=272131 RepID=A0ABR8HK41_NOSPU|nr:WYL domain-containing protein [Nostoc punctiforme FACHB-252]
MEDFLEILDDHRIPPKNGNAKWHFTLSLWSKNKETNLREFTQKWQRKWEQRHPKKSKQKSKISDVPEIVGPVQTQLSDNNIKKDVWSDERIEVLQKALRLFTDIAQMEEALNIADLLLERRELKIPLRTEIETFLRTHKSSWRQEIDGYIDRHQPFQLSYQDATGRLWNYTVHYAKVVPHEERQYLNCWCEETEGNQDVEQLRHNWSFRLDRILEAKVSPIDGKWLPDLDSIKVEMHLFGGLVHGYKSKKNNDISNKLLNVNGQQVRKVLREVSSTFWFFREVIRYAPDCVIVTPDSVRDRFKEKLIPLCKLYNLTISD